MKPAAPLTIFLVSAADNLAALTELHNELLAHGHTVYGRALEARAMQERRGSGGPLLGGEEQLFTRLTLQINAADLFVLVAPDDYDAAFLAGVSHTLGTPVAVIDEDSPLRCCFMVKGCVSFWCNGIGALLETIAEWPDFDAEDQ